jgi:anaerobic selenocysteine-containing dehydrogenase
MSRRSVLHGAAGAGALGLAAAAGAGVAAAATRPAGQPALPPAAKPVTMAAMPEAAMAGPLVVYLRDTTTGEFDVFGGTGQVRVRNPQLVAQLLKNVQLAW